VRSLPLPPAHTVLPQYLGDSSSLHPVITVNLPLTVAADDGSNNADNF